MAQKAEGADDANAGTEEKPWRTLAYACTQLQPGDVLYVHAGHYRECARISSPGLPGSPITIQAFGDDAVIIDGADIVPTAKWQPSPELSNVYEIDCLRDPGQIFLDGKPTTMKLDKLKGKRWEIGVLGNDDRDLWQFDRKRRKLLLNVGGDNPAEGRTVEVPIRAHGVVLRDHCRVSGLQVTRTANVGIECSADYGVVEDCLVTACTIGIRGAGWHKTGSVFRRNTVIATLDNGIYHQDRARGCRILDNLVIGCTLNPWHQVRWSGSMKINGAYDLVYQNNVVLDAGNANTPSGWDGWALWGDCVVGRVYYVGNTTARNEHAGIYIEAEMTDSHAFYNTCQNNTRGITCRASQRGTYMHNLVIGGHAGLSVWNSKGGLPTVNHVFAHNLVRDALIPLHIQQSPQFIDHNVYWPRPDHDLASIGAHKCRSLDDVRRVSGYESNGEVANEAPEDMGLGTITFRAADRKNSDEVLMMIGNNGCELLDPVDNSGLPYFWRPGTGDGEEHMFRFWAYTGIKPAREAHGGVMYSYAYRGSCGGALASAAFKGQSARTGRRCLEVDGQRPEKIPEEGLGWWSPSIPARPGDTIHIGFWARGSELAPVAGTTGLAAFARFTSYTGQNQQDVQLSVPDETLVGTFDWREITSAVTVPEDVRRVALFFGLKPATGAIFFDDFSINVDGAEATRIPPLDKPVGDERIDAQTTFLRVGPTLQVDVDVSRIPNRQPDDKLRVRIKRFWQPIDAKTVPIEGAAGTVSVEFSTGAWPPDRYKLYVELLDARSRIRTNRRFPLVVPRQSLDAGKAADRISLAGTWRGAMTLAKPQVEGLENVYPDPGISAKAQALVKEGGDVSGLREVTVPGTMQDWGKGWEGLNGEAVFRRTVTIPPNWIGKDLVLSLGPIDDFDVTFFNGVRIGATDDKTPSFYRHPRLYTVPAGLLRLGESVICVRVFDRGWGGGFMGKPEQLFIQPRE
ncbi:MAG: hypothetical protein HN742_34810 [Lentisphaerae bacterium]|nr:hypothetical protein [Lentisphaerota bacterium]MBT7059064.1 hypothetical protein [Lentisphaerota bacterium]MBT7847094.1 hypothetical protein [Lentisphaerota bacterium]